MTDYYVPASVLSEIADALRENTGISASLSWPNGFISAANNIIPSPGIDINRLISRTISYANAEDEIIIGSHVFAYCSQLTTVSFPSCTVIGGQAFYYCSELSTVSFPLCTAIGGYAFASCLRLKTVSFPLCTLIGGYAFQSCPLSTVSFPLCTSINGYAFAYCYQLTTISFPLCTSIGNGTFQYCNKLTIISFPSCTTIGSYAFQYCQKLSSIYLLGSSIVTLNNSNAFSSTPIAGYSVYNNNQYGSIYVPASLLASYKAATNWTYYSARMVGI